MGTSLNNFPKRLQQQLQFILEIDKLKQIFRQTPLLDKSRRENDAEHSWHLAMMIMVLSEYAPANLDLFKVMKMVLLHDIVEIDAGDVFLYDNSNATVNKSDKELAAAKRIYGLLPDDLAHELITLWQEFEIRETPEAKFAAAIDRLQPMLINCFAEGGTWKEHHVSLTQIKQSQELIRESSEVLWQLIDSLTSQCYSQGYLND